MTPETEARRAFAAGLAVGASAGRQCDCLGSQWVAVDESNIACLDCDLIVATSTLVERFSAHE